MTGEGERTDQPTNTPAVTREPVAKPGEVKSLVPELTDEQKQQRREALLK